MKTIAELQAELEVAEREWEQAQNRMHELQYQMRIAEDHLMFMSKKVTRLRILALSYGIRTPLDLRRAK